MRWRTYAAQCPRASVANIRVIICEANGEACDSTSVLGSKPARRRQRRATDARVLISEPQQYGIDCTRGSTAEFTDGS